MQNRIIAVDDEQTFLDTIKRGILTSGYEKIVVESSARKAVALFDKGDIFDVAIIDITMPGMDGFKLLEKIKNKSPETECIMLTAVDDTKKAVRAMKMGAYDYLVKPVDKYELVLSIDRALERKKLKTILDISKNEESPNLENKEAFKNIITVSSKMKKILKEAELHAVSRVPVLITGESGTGKELLAKAIHSASLRAGKPFLPVNMAALSPAFFDSEFFGHIKGAFTGADRDRKGYLELADQGTLFLDEIGTLPNELQGKLLRTLQEGEFVKLGTNKPLKSDIRFITATNENIDKLLIKKEFRNDLYYRLKGGWLDLPPLRERKEDIPILVSSFLAEISGIERKILVDEKAQELLLGYDYPGNIRELRTIIHSATNLSERRTIYEDHLPIELIKCKSKNPDIDSCKSSTSRPLSAIEKKYIVKVYKETGKNKTKAARVLGIGLNTLRRKLEDYKVN